MPDERILTLEVCADRMGFSVRTLQRKIEKDEIKAVWDKKIKGVKETECEINMKTDAKKKRNETLEVEKEVQ